MSDEKNSIIPPHMVDAMKKNKKTSKKAKVQEVVDNELREERLSQQEEISSAEDVKEIVNEHIEQDPPVENKFRKSTDKGLKRSIDDHNKRHGFAPKNIKTK